MNDIINSLFNKLSAYQLLSLMLPGARMLGIMKFIFTIDIKVDENIWWFLLASYVVGIIISRIGSLLIEEVFKKIGFIKGFNVANYIAKRKEDDMVETILSFANLYRSYCALSIVLIIVTIVKGYGFCEYWLYYLLEFLLLLLFSFSFCKQYYYFYSIIPKD